MLRSLLSNPRTLEIQHVDKYQVERRKFQQHQEKDGHNGVKQRCGWFVRSVIIVRVSIVRQSASSQCTDTSRKTRITPCEESGWQYKEPKQERRMPPRILRSWANCVSTRGIVPKNVLLGRTSNERQGVPGVWPHRAPPGAPAAAMFMPPSGRSGMEASGQAVDRPTSAMLLVRNKQ